MSMRGIKAKSNIFTFYVVAKDTTSPMFRWGVFTYGVKEQDFRIDWSDERFSLHRQCVERLAASFHRPGIERDKIIKSKYSLTKRLQRLGANEDTIQRAIGSVYGEPTPNND